MSDQTAVLENRGAQFGFSPIARHNRRAFMGNKSGILRRRIRHLYTIFIGDQNTRIQVGQADTTGLIAVLAEFKAAGAAGFGCAVSNVQLNVRQNGQKMLAGRLIQIGRTDGNHAQLAVIGPEMLLRTIQQNTQVGGRKEHNRHAVLIHQRIEGLNEYNAVRRNHERLGDQAGIQTTDTARMIQREGNQRHFIFIQRAVVRDTFAGGQLVQMSTQHALGLAGCAGREHDIAQVILLRESIGEGAVILKGIEIIPGDLRNINFQATRRNNQMRLNLLGNLFHTGNGNLLFHRHGNRAHQMDGQQRSGMPDGLRGMQNDSVALLHSRLLQAGGMTQNLRPQLTIGTNLIHLCHTALIWICSCMCRNGLYDAVVFDVHCIAPPFSVHMSVVCLTLHSVPSSYRYRTGPDPRFHRSHSRIQKH